MKEKNMNQKKSYRVGIRSIDRTIRRLVGMTGEVRNQDMLLQIATTVAKIGREEFTRGDLKLINATLKELRWAFRVFEPYRQISKVAIFGSARTPRNLPIYRSAKKLGQLMADAGWMVITGGSSGIMRAGNEGAGREKSFGVNIRLPFEQESNVYVADSRLIHFKYFFTRKLTFLKESNATVLYPGGFGTHDEGYETLTLVQTGKGDPRPIVLVDTPQGTYWDSWMAFVQDGLLKEKMIDRNDCCLVRRVRSPEEARDEILHFYRVYHSLRYVGEQTVIRLTRKISPAALKQINRQFSSLLHSGRIVQSGALEQESDEPEISTLPRLVFKFNRKNYGTLRKMIDILNKE